MKILEMAHKIDYQKLNNVVIQYSDFFFETTYFCSILNKTSAIIIYFVIKI